jgi:hypothetical protein
LDSSRLKCIERKKFDVLKGFLADKINSFESVSLSQILKMDFSHCCTPPPSEIVDLAFRFLNLHVHHRASLLSLCDLASYVSLQDEKLSPLMGTTPTDDIENGQLRMNTFVSLDSPRLDEMFKISANLGRSVFSPDATYWIFMIEGDHRSLNLPFNLCMLAFCDLSPGIVDTPCPVWNFIQFTVFLMGDMVKATTSADFSGFRRAASKLSSFPKALWDWEKWPNIPSNQRILAHSKIGLPYSKFFATSHLFYNFNLEKSLFEDKLSGLTFSTEALWSGAFSCSPRIMASLDISQFEKIRSLIVSVSSISSLILSNFERFYKPP